MAGWLARHRPTLEADLRKVAAAGTAGLLLGFAVNGWGSRLAMMLLARLNPSVTGTVSDDGFVIGQFDLGQTMGLVAFGTAVGVIGGMAYLLVRPLRFGPWWFSTLALVLGPSVVVGNMLVHTDGVDFNVLEPAWLAVALFVGLPGLYALGLILLVERWSREDSWFARARLPHVAPLLLPIAILWPVLIAAAAIAGTRALVLDRRVDAPPPGLGPARWAARAALVAVFGVSLLDLSGKVGELV